MLELAHDRCVAAAARSFGPDGTDQLRVLIYEADSQHDVRRCQRHGIQHDWRLDGVATHPIVNESPLQLDMSIWRPFGYPHGERGAPVDYEIVIDTRNATSFSSPKPMPSLAPTSTALCLV